MRLDAPSAGLRPPATETGPEISVVVPLFDEEENLPELYGRLVHTLETAGHDFELVFVNDGSNDATAQILNDLYSQDGRVVAVHLSRNFGHQAAISAGIDHARGHAVIVMDGDLQDPPEALPRFIDAWRQGSDVVYAVRTKRKEGWFTRCCYALFYRLFRAVSDLEMPLDSGDFCLMDAHVANVIRQFPERERFVRGLRSFAGFRQTGIEYERAARQSGRPKYTFTALCGLALNGLVGFSSLPLRLLSLAGLTFLGLTLPGLGWLVIQATRAEVPGWSVVLIALLGCTGLQLLGMGVLGEYIRRIFQETKARPTYIVGSIKQEGQDAATAHKRRRA